MNPLKIAIFNEVKKQHPNAVKLSDDALNEKFFTKTTGLRLTFSGFIVLRKIFTAYSFELKHELKSKHFIGMSRLEFPYYVTERRLILFSEMDAAVIKLHGSVENFLETCFNTEKEYE